MSKSLFGNSRGPRGPVPPGVAGWVVIGALALPFLARYARPVVRKLGEGLARVGEKLREAANERPLDVAVEDPTAEVAPEATQAAAPPSAKPSDPAAPRRRKRATRAKPKPSPSTRSTVKKPRSAKSDSSGS